MLLNETLKVLFGYKRCILDVLITGALVWRVFFFFEYNFNIHLQSNQEI